MGRPPGVTYSQARREELTNQLLQRVITGQALTKAADDLGIRPATARHWYQKAIQAVYDENVHLREAALGRELKTLDLLQRALWPNALRGNVRSVEVMLAVMDRRAKYLGLDAAVKVQVDIGAVDEAVAQVAQIIDGSAQAGAAQLLRAVPEAG